MLAHGAGRLGVTAARATGRGHGWQQGSHHTTPSGRRSRTCSCMPPESFAMHVRHTSRSVSRRRSVEPSLRGRDAIEPSVRPRLWTPWPGFTARRVPSISCGASALSPSISRALQLTAPPPSLLLLRKGRVGAGCVGGRVMWRGGWRGARGSHVPAVPRSGARIFLVWGPARESKKPASTAAVGPPPIRSKSHPVR